MNDDNATPTELSSEIELKFSAQSGGMGVCLKPYSKVSNVPLTLRHIVWGWR